ncbi:MAG: UDP-N-acetylglucosamine 1-carboxyvinyltransferase, partial [Lachnospiraceae bacterium]|nr:UDP-N-acetylglucosamine 1-carboxyvinyltransferase [Lachnospiraceae bacterium]
YAIKGGNPLVGEVEIGGAKNAALGILAASIMTDETVVIENVPDVRDTNVMMKAIESIGGIVESIDRHTVKISGRTIDDVVIEDGFIKKIRASYYLLGALLGKYKRAQVTLPGGCNIGLRPIDQHIKGFRALGADVRIEHGLIIAEAERLRGSHIYLDVVTVGATIDIMMAAVMAEGQTIIENAAKEPHVVDVANFLNSMGAVIKGAGTDVIRIKGVPKLHGTEYVIIPDQIEAGTFMFAAAVTKGDVTVKNVIPKHLESISAKLIEVGCEVEESDDAVRVVAAKPLTHTHVKTLPYPGFPTDMQPQITVALGLSRGTSIVTESIFENRFKYVDELTRMGANIKVEGNTAIIDGVGKYTGASISAPDLRAGAALVIAGLAAEGTTTVDDIQFIERGYEDFHIKLKNLGAQIEKIASEREQKKFRLKTG